MRRHAAQYILLSTVVQLAVTSIDGSCRVTVPNTWTPVEGVRWAANHPDGGDIQLWVSHDLDWSITRKNAMQYNVTDNHMTVVQNDSDALAFERVSKGSYEFRAVRRMPGRPARQCAFVFGRNAYTIPPATAAQLGRQMRQIATTFAW